MRTLLTLAAMIAIGAGVLLAVIYFWQSNLILLPGITGGSPDVLTQCGPGSTTWQDNGKYRGKICEPASTAKGTVVAYHGNAGTVDDRALLVSALTAQGLRAVLVEYPGYGQRTGRATVNEVLDASLEDFGIAHAKWPSPIYLLGESFGAGIAAEVVKRHGDKVAGVILITPWDSLANVVNAKFLIPLSFLLHQRFDTAQALSDYRGSVVIVAAERDEVLPVRHARALAKALPSAAYLELRDAGHNDWIFSMTKKDWDTTMRSLVVSEPVR